MTIAACEALRLHVMLLASVSDLQPYRSPHVPRHACCVELAQAMPAVLSAHAATNCPAACCCVFVRTVSISPDLHR